MLNVYAYLALDSMVMYGRGHLAGNKREKKGRGEKKGKNTEVHKEEEKKEIYAVGPALE